MNARTLLPILLLPLALPLAAAGPSPICGEVPTVEAGSDGYGNDYVHVHLCTDPGGPRDVWLPVPKGYVVEVRNGDEVWTCRFSFVTLETRECNMVADVSDLYCDRFPTVERGHDGYGNGYFRVTSCTLLTGPRDDFYPDPTYDVLGW